jgi:hypothetical protein
MPDEIGELVGQIMMSGAEMFMTGEYEDQEPEAPPIEQSQDGNQLADADQDLTQESHGSVNEAVETKITKPENVLSLEERQKRFKVCFCLPRPDFFLRIWETLCLLVQLLGIIKRNERIPILHI